MRGIARTRHSYVLRKALTVELACNDKDIGKPNGSESRIYLRGAASNPKALLTAVYTTIKNAGALRGSYRLTEQPKMWAHLFKNPHYKISEMRF